MSSGPVNSIDEYLASVPPASRAALEELRAVIKATAPEAVETISYQIPTFKLHGKMLVSFAAFKNHCSFFPASSRLLDDHKDELKDFRTSKGTIQFTVDKPLPRALVTKLVKERVAENRSKE